MSRIAHGLLAVLLPTLLVAQATDAPRPGDPAQAIDPRGVSGARLLAGGGRLPDSVYERFLELAGGKHARIVLIPTASARADQPEGRERTLQRWRDAHPGVHFQILHTRDRTVADSEAFTAPLRRARGVWLGGGAQKRLADAYVGTRVERELHALLERGGIVGGSSAGTAIQTRVMIERGMEPPVLSMGFDLLPFAISDQHFLKRKRLPRLILALAMAPGHFGVGIDEGTAILVQGRDLEVLGNSLAVLVMPARHGKVQRIVELSAGEHVDLPTWQRAARQRGVAAWPPAKLAAPRVDKGALVLGGGGEMPDTVFARFVELAGGKHARIVWAPTATPALASHGNYVQRKLQQLGVHDIRTLEPEHPSSVIDFHIDMIDRANGVWFDGGRQWRIVDAFEGTGVQAALHRLLARGGVIGGSSAGASIQGDFLVRGNPQNNTDVWCEGYDRGYGFLPGCAIDQHFVARNRTADLQALIQLIPQVVGLGIDEATAAVVMGSTLEVLGSNKLAVFDARGKAGELAPDWLEPGQKWDLVTGKRKQ